MSDMYVYRNKNTEQVLQHDGPHMRLERLGNWERIVGDDPAEPETELDVPLDLSGLGEAQVAVDGPDVAQVDDTGTDESPAEQPAANTDDVPDGVMADVLAWVGEDAERARAALDAEQQREKPRATLVSALELMLKVYDDEADGE